VINCSGTNTLAVGRGITFAGIDHTTSAGVDTNIPVQKIYTTTTVTNSGLIKGDSDAGIRSWASAATTNTPVTITNTAGGLIVEAAPPWPPSTQRGTQARGTGTAQREQ